MKHTLLALFFFLSYTMFSQTTEEWNYLHKGLKIQQESGLDMKAGYSFKKINTGQVKNSINVSMNYLVSSVGKNVAISVIFEYPDKRKLYFAIPLTNSYYVDTYFQFLKQLSATELSVLSYALSSIHFTLKLE